MFGKSPIIPPINSINLSVDESNNLDDDTKKTYMVAGIIGVLGVLVILYKTRKK